MNEVCRTVSSIRDKPKIVVNGYLYVKDKNRKEKYYWCCEYRNPHDCKGRAVTVLSDDTNQKHTLVNVSEHNYAPEASRMSVIQTLNTIKESATHTHDQPIQIIQDAIINMPQ